jgi:hypothetical protein
MDRINIGWVRAETVLVIAGYELGDVSEYSENVLDRGVRRTDRTSATTQSKRVFFKSIEQILVVRAGTGWLGGLLAGSWCWL